MKKTRRQILVLHEDPVLRECLMGVARSGSGALEWVADWEALQDAVKSAPASAIVVVDPYAGMPNRGEISIELSALMNRYPSVAVVAAIEMRPGCIEDARRLGEYGVVQIIDLDGELSGRHVAALLTAVCGRPLRTLVQRALPRYTGAAARSILATAARTVSEAGHGSDLARALHITPRTLSRWCRRAGLPPPRRLLAWMRVLLAAEMLDDPGRTVSDVAFACGYSADGSLRHAFRAFVDLSPTELRARGAFDTVAEGFLRELAAARSGTARYRARPQGTS